MEDLSKRFFDLKQFDFELEKKKFIDSMNFLKSLDVSNFTFFKKHEEITKLYNDNSGFFSNSREVKAKIWSPEDINNEEYPLPSNFSSHTSPSLRGYFFLNSVLISLNSSFLILLSRTTFFMYFTKRFL